MAPANLALSGTIPHVSHLQGLHIAADNLLPANLPLTCQACDFPHKRL